jgi:CRP-like cAMP-binding protein
LRIHVATLARIIDERSEIRAAVMRFVQMLARQLMQMAAWNASDTLQQRYARWLLMARDRLDGDVINITHETLSSLLGVRRSGITVAGAALQRQGLIRTSRGRVTILDRNGLQARLEARRSNDAKTQVLQEQAR